MSLLAERQKTAEAIAQGRFVNHVLSEASNELDDDIKERMSSFTSSFWQQRNFSISAGKMVYTTKKVHRFQDMKTRQTKNGVIKKKRTQMHNKPIFGHLNNIIRELNFGFTKAIKAKFMQLES